MMQSLEEKVETYRFYIKIHASLGCKNIINLEPR